MKHARLTASFLVGCLLVVSAPSQTGGVQRFAAGGLSFDYPAGWTLEDRSDARMQRLVLKNASTSAAFEVIAQRGLVSSVEEVVQARQSFTLPLIGELVRGLGPRVYASTAPCAQLGQRLITGFRVLSPLEKTTAVGELYEFVMARRYVNLIYVRKEADEPRAADAWRLLLGTLKAEGPGVTSDAGAELVQLKGVVLGGMARRKPAPRYPKAAKKSRTQGEVVVEVVADEKGKVVSAKAVSGPPELYEVSEEAARKAQFNPTLFCGRPVKASGHITYNFILER